MDWMNIPGAVLLNSERKFLYDTAREIMVKFRDAPRVHIVNIGVMWGGSVACLAAGAYDADPDRSRIHAIDIDFETYPVKIGRDDQIEYNVEFILDDSHTMTWGLPVHLLFVDGDHKYESVRADIENWVEYVVPGGIVAFHDYAPRERDLEQFPWIAGVKQAVDEWKARVDLAWVEVPAPGSIRAFRRGK